MKLETRAALRLAITLILLACLLFPAAGSLHFWQAWLLIAIMAAFWTYFLVALLKHDPRLIERRLQTRESDPAQKWALRLFSAVLYSGFVLSGLDFRFGWSRATGAVPLGLVVAGQVAVAAGYCLVFRVMKTNTFAASTIRVKAEQVVIDRGPYALVRHPMYTGMAIMMVATPLALGSYVALPVFGLMVPVLVFRLIHEERSLRRSLPGYPEYCERTQFRLVPGVW